MKNLRPHIGIFGRRNVGKSSFINAITKQDVSIVSEIAGTTTDPVDKVIEFLGFGPVVLIDTAGIDDTGELGKKRIQNTKETIAKVDLAILVIAENNYGTYEKQLLQEFKEFNVPFYIVYNKTDLDPISPELKFQIKEVFGFKFLEFSSKNALVKYDNEKKQEKIDKEIDKLVYEILSLVPENSFKPIAVFDNLVQAKDKVVLVCPIDSEAPEGRLILPQMKAIRDLLDKNAIAIVLQETELDDFFADNPQDIKLVVTDSQAFEYVAKHIPKSQALTSFSILFARMNGDFERFIAGTKEIKNLRDGANIIIMESCSHNISDEDIGRYKIPAWLEKVTEKKFNFDVVSGFNQPPKPIEEYSLLIQCGGCMFTRKQVLGRLSGAIKANIPITNYGMTIAYLKGIFDRSLEPLKIL